MAEKKLTPIQSVNEMINRMRTASYTPDGIILELQKHMPAMLAKEKDFAKDMWDSGNIKRESKKNIFAIQQPDFEKFYKQYEP